MAAHPVWRSSLLVGLAVTSALVATVLLEGCGQIPATSGSPSPAASTSTSVFASSASTSASTSGSTSTSSSGGTTTASSVSSIPSASSSTDSATTTATARGVAGVFAELATTARPMTIFAPSFLPEGATIADTWRPVVESAAPDAYQGPAISNPRILGSGVDSDIQVVFRVGSGWLAILEGFRGDLGDVAGISVGSVVGHPASLYEVNGGELVQWSQDGLWYGVFGRGVGRDDIVAVALGMRDVSGESR